MPDTLAQRIRAKYPGAYDDLNDQQLESSIKAKYPGVYDDIPTTAAPSSLMDPSRRPVSAEDFIDKGQRAEGATFAEKLGNAAKMIGGALPTVGGMVGGAVGGVPGAAIGGAAGEGYRDILQNVTELPGAVRDVARGVMENPAETLRGFGRGAVGGGADAAMEAGGQAAGQVMGAGLAKGAGAMSKWLMNRATSRVSAKLMQDFPGLNETLIDNALTVSKGGYTRAHTLLMEAKGKANAALKLADETERGIPISFTPDIAESLKTALLEKAIKSGKTKALTPGEPLSTATARLDEATRSLFQRVDDAAQSGGTGYITPSQADLLKTQLQKESKALYANRAAPNGPKAVGMDATERAEFASRLNDMIGDVAPGYRAANAEARPLIGATRGIQQAIRPSGNLYQAMVRPAVGAALGGAAGSREGGPGSLAGAVMGAYATSPKGMSQEAILLANPALQGALRALPKPVVGWILDAIAKREGQPR